MGQKKLTTSVTTLQKVRLDRPFIEDKGPEQHTSQATYEANTQATEAILQMIKGCTRPVCVSICRRYVVVGVLGTDYIGIYRTHGLHLHPHPIYLLTHKYLS
jgi:hypothetical protein